MLDGGGGRFGCVQSTNEYSVVSSKGGKSFEYTSDEIDDSAVDDDADEEVVEKLPKGVIISGVIVSARWRGAKRPCKRG